MTKSLKLPKDTICLVGIEADYEQPLIIAAFKTKQLAEKFVKEAKKLIDKYGQVTIGNYEVSKNDYANLRVISGGYMTSNTEELPFFT